MIFRIKQSTSFQTSFQLDNRGMIYTYNFAYDGNQSFGLIKLISGDGIVYILHQCLEVWICRVCIHEFFKDIVGIKAIHAVESFDSNMVLFVS